jgi:ribosomal-protein-alanine N-acetyltransferase
LIPEGLIIRRVEGRDLERIRDLADTRLNEEYSEELFNHFFERYPQCFLVAENGKTVMGFVLGIPLDAKTMRILMLAVDENHTRMGIGSALMDASMKYARDRMMTTMVLEVGSMNKKAFDFYLKKGFKMTGVLTKYYKDRTDAFVMKRFLEM